MIPFFISCGSEKKTEFKGAEVNFGVAEYYEPFLWVKSDTSILVKKLKFSFNDFAFESKSKVILSFTDENEQIIKDDVELYVDGLKISNKSIILKSNTAKQGYLSIGIRFIPGFNEGVSTGFIKIKNTDLDRINNNELSSSGENRLIKWRAENKVIMNPLLKGILWFVILIVSGLIIWFVLLRNMIYPKMGKGSIFIQGQYISKPIKTKGARKIVLTNKSEKQTILNRIFAGRIVSEVNPFWEQKIVLTPFRKRQLRVQLGSDYIISPYTNTFVRGGGDYEMKRNNINFKISYL